MEEMLDFYDEKGNLLGTRTKKEVLNEQKTISLETGESPFAVPVIHLLLSHPEKGIYTVQRANKSENPYLWCKPVGGHISSGETEDSTLIREGQEEIKTDIILANSEEEYLNLISNDSLTKHAIVRKIDFQPWLGAYRLDRDTGKMWMKRTRTHIYAGVYRGKIGFTQTTDQEEFNDGLGEAVGVKIYKKEDLDKLLLEKNNTFTEDFKTLFRDYKELL
ncbi:NUDIX domain-containing protein [Candidatus Woesearchaeota archaeon]|jgi:hypothetical protein|nr:NUDIX domain-containing protein [Candidatus Woesearchaeota archaeon]MBT5341986.1 NUDIX domain-containing protein [Candidatus Woesearchaeota archaeon]